MPCLDVELLVVSRCPNEAPAWVTLDAILAEMGLERVEVRTTVIDSALAADRRGFVGSPTILINGRDPFSTAGAPIGLACRLYPTSTGLVGVPDTVDLRRALERAAHPPEGRDEKSAAGQAPLA